MQGSGLQLVLRVADNGPPITEVERYMASFTTLLIHARGEVALLGNCLDPPDEFVSPHNASIGRLCPKRNGVARSAGNRCQIRDGRRCFGAFEAIFRPRWSFPGGLPVLPRYRQAQQPGLEGVRRWSACDQI